MRRHPKAFDDLYVNMVAAGEAGGILDTILQRLSTYIEKAVKLRSQVRAALIYPVAVIAIAAIVVAIILLEGHPDVRRPLHQPRAPSCRFPTRVVIGASQLPRALLHLLRHRHRRVHLRLPALLQDVPRTAGRRRHRAQDPDPRHDPAQDRRRPVLPDARDPDVLGRADPRRASRSRRGRPATRSSRTRSSRCGRASRTARPWSSRSRTPRSSRRWSSR